MLKVRIKKRKYEGGSLKHKD